MYCRWRTLPFSPRNEHVSIMQKVVIRPLPLGLLLFGTQGEGAGRTFIEKRRGHPWKKVVLVAFIFIHEAIAKKANKLSVPGVLVYCIRVLRTGPKRTLKASQFASLSE